MTSDITPLLPLLALYAETHYRPFRFFPSLLFRRFPEVIFDAPARIGPGADLPVSLVMHDLDKFPVTLDSVAVAVTRLGQPPFSCAFSDPAEYEVRQPFTPRDRAFIFPIPRAKIPDGTIYVNARATLRRRSGTREVLNDNLPGTSKTPFTCLVTDEMFPASEVSSYGDLHAHSQFSESHVEFGPPVPVIARMARSMGLSFFAVTDHSYDLACRVEDYLLEDPQVPRWKLLSDEIAATSGPDRPIALLSEEISCLNSRGKVVHLCGIGIKDFVEGSLDGARLKILHDKELSIGDVVDNVKAQGGVTFGAHPGAKAELLQRLVLRRGIWSSNDVVDGLTGLQAMNGGFSSSWERAKQMWIKGLLSGKRLALVAGNDSHGDFNRYRCLKVPFVQVSESPRHFGSGMTGVYGKPRDSGELVDLLRDGKTFVTEGPFLGLSRTESPGDSLISRYDIEPDVDSIFVHSISTYEFGIPAAVRVLHGVVGESKEQVVLERSYAAGHTFEASEEISTSALSGEGYLRAELACAMPDRGLTRAFTSPCYFKKKR